MSLKIGNLYRLKLSYYLFPSKEVLKACFSFDNDSEEFFMLHEKEIGYIGTEVIFALLKEDYLKEIGCIYEILSTDGKIGWIVSSEKDFEEVKNQ